MNPTYKTIDLCAGIGGIRRGFELTGQFENVLSAEIDDAACNTYEHIFGDSPKNDLTSDKFKELVEQTNYDVLLAGFPCQTFSRAGKQEGFRDTTKGTIFFDIADIISKTSPRAIFLENVENLVGHDKGETLKRIISVLEDELGYRIIGVSTDENGSYIYSRKSFVRNSKNFGLPQNRPRAYIMAFSKAFYGDAIKFLDDNLPTESNKIIANDLNDILEPVVDDNYYMAEEYLSTLKRHKARERSRGHGFGYSVVNAPEKKHPVANTILATGGSGKERNLVYQPKEGVAGKQLPRKKSKINDEGIRTMTPTEWGRLQGFIGYAFLDEAGYDHFEFPEGTTMTQQYKQFGNSVTIPVIETMANFMLSCFEKMSKDPSIMLHQMCKNSDTFSKQDIVNYFKVSPEKAADILKKTQSAGLTETVIRGRNAKYKLLKPELNS